MKHDVTVNGCRFEVWEEGEGDAVPVFLIHGEGHGIDYFEHLLPHLAQSRRVIAYSRRGHGKTQTPEWGWSVHLQARDAVGLLDALGVTGPVDILAVAFGTTVAAELTLEYSDRVRSLAMVAWSEIEGIDDYLALFERQTPGVLETIDREGQEGLRRELLARGREWSPVWPGRPEHQEVYARWLSERVPAGWLGRLEFVSSVPEYAERLAATTIPMLGLEGGNDPFPCDPQTLAGNPHFEQHYIPGADRFIHWEHPEQFNALVDQFLERVERLAVAGR